MSAMHKLLFVDFDDFGLIARNHLVSFFLLDLLVDLVFLLGNLFRSISRYIEVTNPVYAVFPLDELSRMRNHYVLVLEIGACFRSDPDGTLCPPLMILVPLHLG